MAAVRLAPVKRPGTIGSGRHAVDLPPADFSPRQSQVRRPLAALGVIRSVPLLKMVSDVQSWLNTPANNFGWNSTARANSRPPASAVSPRATIWRARQPSPSIHARAGAGTLALWGLGGLGLWLACRRRGARSKVKFEGGVNCRRISRISPTRPMRHRQGRLWRGRLSSSEDRRVPPSCSCGLASGNRRRTGPGHAAAELAQQFYVGQRGHGEIVAQGRPAGGVRDHLGQALA